MDTHTPLGEQLKYASGLLIKGGSVVDGTGRPAFVSDVRVGSGIIREIDVDLEPLPGEAVFDASDCLVTPGFIDHHTHYDGAVFWAPALEPSAGYGITTIIMGNCSFGLAPLRTAEAHGASVDIMALAEDLPVDLFGQLPWTWKSWQDYGEAMRLNTELPVNYGAYVGHLQLRFAVLGSSDAWSRAASQEEIAEMVRLLEDALSAGAMGLSTNFFDRDRQGRPVPSMQASDEELRALLEAVAIYPGATVQVTADAFWKQDADETMRRFAKLAKDLPLKIQWLPFPMFAFQKLSGLQQRAIDLHRELSDQGSDIRPVVPHYPLSLTMALTPSKEASYKGAGELVWWEVAKADSASEKIRLLKDEGWRSRARRSWDECQLAQSIFANPRPALLDNSENGVGPIDITLGEYADQLGLHPSDALAEWFILNGVGSTVLAPPMPIDTEVVVELLKDPKALAAVSDGGAHLQTICAAGINLELITKYARDEQLITIEHAIHIQTGKIADFFDLPDRGRLAVGMRADIAVFDLQEIECRTKHKTWDLPSEESETAWRWTRDPAPMRLTLVNGIATFEGGCQTSARPGTMIAPGKSAQDPFTGDLSARQVEASV